MKNVLKSLAGIFGIIAIDQITKGILLFLITGSFFAFGPAWDVVSMPYMMARVTNFFNVVFTWNPGAAFSAFRSLGDSLPLVIILGTAIIIGLILYYLFCRAQSYERVPLIMIAGGALGNLLDRVRFGAVIDFLDFHIGGWHWPAFNVADIFISVGVMLYVLNWYLARRRCLRNLKKGE